MDSAGKQSKQRMLLTAGEYERAKGLVTVQPRSTSDIGVAGKAELPWDTAATAGGVPLVAAPGVDFATEARLRSNEDLIAFLQNPQAQSPNSIAFGSRYVHAWRELKLRVDQVSEGLEAQRRAAADRERLVDQRETRAEKRSRISIIIAAVAVLIAGASLLLNFLRRC